MTHGGLILLSISCPRFFCSTTTSTLAEPFYYWDTSMGTHYLLWLSPGGAHSHWNDPVRNPSPVCRRDPLSDVRPRSLPEISKAFPPGNRFNEHRIVPELGDMSSEPNRATFQARHRGRVANPSHVSIQHLLEEHRSLRHNLSSHQSPAAILQDDPGAVRAVDCPSTTPHPPWPRPTGPSGNSSTPVETVPSNHFRQ